MSRPIYATFDGAALRHNYLLARRRAPGAKLWAVIKANAYGHGQMRAAAALADVADGFALLEVSNAIALREAGYQHPILLLEGFFSSSEVPLLEQYRLTPVIYCREQLEMLAVAVRPMPIYLKLNTGMNRLGLVPSDMPWVWKRLGDLLLDDVTLMTHFADADGPRGVAAQMDHFRAMAGGWAGRISLANSAALLRYPGTHGDWARPGIMLYGGSPFADQSALDLGLQPVMSLESRIIGIQELEAGQSIGYGASFTTTRPTRVGIVACGYADGYPRHAPTGTPIAVNGVLTRTLGRVSMDMLACDLTAVPEGKLGAKVTLWGKGEGGDVPADDVATAAGTISYELFCALAPRVPVKEI